MINVLASYDSGGTLNARFITPGLDGNLSMTTGGNNYYYFKDGLGSVRNLVDSSQVAQNTYDYYAFGRELGSWTENVTNRYTYTAREYDAESAQYYYRARYYDGGGRFNGRDSARDGVNLYVYVANRPVVSTDATGRVTESDLRSKFTPFSSSNAINPRKDPFGDYPYWNTNKAGGFIYGTVLPSNDDVTGLADSPGGFQASTSHVYCIYFARVVSTYRKCITFTNGTNRLKTHAKNDVAIAWVKRPVKGINLGIWADSRPIMLAHPFPAWIGRRISVITSSTWALSTGEDAATHSCPKRGDFHTAEDFQGILSAGTGGGNNTNKDGRFIGRDFTGPAYPKR